MRRQRRKLRAKKHLKPNDDRDYEYRVLDNGLSVLLVSDPSADKAAASLVVDAGWFDDPPDRSGLAHFLEHMLFLGTEKYPDTDEYQRYISTYGGRHNAYTSGDHTNNFFDIQPDRLEGALDRFAQFFIAPRLDAEYVDREKNAVDSEYQLYVQRRRLARLPRQQARHESRAPGLALQRGQPRNARGRRAHMRAT